MVFHFDNNKSMQIVFYVLPSNSDDQYYDFILKFVQKSYNLENKILIYSDQDECQNLDQLLWFDHHDTFIPHAILDEVDSSFAKLPVALTYSDNIVAKAEDFVLILQQSIPETLPKCNRIVEIVDQDQTRVQFSRLRYKEYKAKGYDIKTHKM